MLSNGSNVAIPAERENQRSEADIAVACLVISLVSYCIYCTVYDARSTYQHVIVKKLNDRKTTEKCDLYHILNSLMYSKLTS